MAPLVEAARPIEAIRFEAFVIGIIPAVRSRTSNSPLVVHWAGRCFEDAGERTRSALSTGARDYIVENRDEFF